LELKKGSSECFIIAGRGSTIKKCTLGKTGVQFRVVVVMVVCSGGKERGLIGWGEGISGGWEGYILIIERMTVKSSNPLK